ncbi:MAG: Hemin transport protein [Pseudomarimonas sp.]
MTSFCTPQTLAQLGPMLCLYPAVDDNPLIGWEIAQRGAYCAGIDSDGPHESLLFFAGDGRPCWQLCLLPETDFLRWEHLSAAMPTRADWLPGTGLRLAPKHPVARVIGSPLWRACPLQLHAISTGTSGQRLAAACANLSLAGVREVARLAGGALLVGSQPS